MKERKGNRTIKITLIILILLFLSIAGFFAIKLYIGADLVKPIASWEQYSTILNNREKKEWQELTAQEGVTYMQLNARVAVDDQQAEIRLIVPPYAGYSCQVSMRLEGGSDSIWNSERLYPATVIEQITLNKSLAAGEYTAIVEYTFFDIKGKIEKVDQIEIVLVVQ